MKRKFTIICFLLIPIVSAVTSCTTPKSSTGYQKTIATARTEIWKTITPGGASSATVAISDGDKIVYQEGFAMANRTTATPVNSETQFNICSISKMFSTMAVLQLCQQGKLDLDQPVAYLSPGIHHEG